MRQPSLGLTPIMLIGLLIGGSVLWGLTADHIDGSPVNASDRPVVVETDSGVVILDRLALDTLEVGRPEGPYDWKRIARRNGRQFAECHESLVRAQTRLRQTGHEWSDELGTWVRTGR